jgi:hypothetical protein
MDKYQAEANYCKQGRNCEATHVTGTWSNIYDQGFQINLENGMRFVANFKYSIKPNITKAPLSLVQTEQASELWDLKTSDYFKFNSECDKTMIGFVQSNPEKSS